MAASKSRSLYHEEVKREGREKGRRRREKGKEEEREEEGERRRRGSDLKTPNIASESLNKKVEE